MEKHQKRAFADLRFKDNFMFAAVMMDEENARGVLERALGIEIGRIEIEYEKCIVYNPEYKGVRLDVYAKDDENNHFDVEMQVINEEIFKRSRYYHSQIDMELLESGMSYDKLPDAYVIFICDFDPIGLKKYKYTVRQTLEEDEEYTYEDGRHTIYLSTVGENDDEVPEALVRLLKFTGSEEDDKSDYQDEFVEKLQKTVNKVKRKREFGRRYMLLSEMLKREYDAGVEDGRREGIAKSIIEILNDIEPISDNLREKIMLTTDEEKLSELITKAARVNSIEEFELFLD